jgi:two-component system LytT family response regulator
LRAATGTHLVRDAMAAIERRLDPRRFVRIHRSAIVNVDKVKELRPAFHGEFEVVLSSGRRLRCSRTYAPDLTRVMQS